jgi:rSAM/selenodomain-associated transferase 2
MVAQVSIIIPTFNEANSIKKTYESLSQCLTDEQLSCNVIVVDGGSIDGTLMQVSGLVDHVVSSERGRAIQMNAGAAAAEGQYLLFLHADTHLPDDFTQCFLEVIASRAQWGFFKVQLDGTHWMFKWISRFINWRSNLTSIGTGDQALFIERNMWIQQQGFAAIDIMEDVEFCKRLRQACRPYVIESRVQTSSRRWQKYGVWKTIFLMWRMRLYYFLGVHPKNLKRLYF